jgi:hypothetical protein
MRAELYLKAETDEDEKQLEDWAGIHFQTLIQDFLEEECLGKLGLDPVALPDVYYLNQKGVLMHSVRQGYKGDSLAQQATYAHQVHLKMRKD